MFKALKGVVRLAFWAVAILGIGFISWKGKPMKDHAWGYAQEGLHYVRHKAHSLEKRLEEILERW